MDERVRETSAVVDSRLDDGSVDARLSELAAQIVSSLSQKNKSKIAVVEFSDLNGNISELGQFLAEELITRLYRTGSFEVVERQLLNKVIEEHTLNLSGLVDEASAKALGRILGVDAIATGSITDLGTVLKINARLISAETGSIFAVAAVELPRNESVSRLMQRQLKPRDPKAAALRLSDATTPSNLGQQTPEMTSAKGDTFFAEDFSRTEEGMIPRGWVGGATMAVHTSKKKSGSLVLDSVKVGQHDFTIPNIPFPKKWKFDIEMFFEYIHNNEHVQIDFGNLRVIFTDLERIVAAGSAAPFDNDGLHDEPFLLTVEYLNPIVRVYINAQRVIVTRCDGMDTPRAITMNATTDRFGIYRMVGTLLP